MPVDCNTENAQQDFRELFEGRCLGIRKWSDFDRLLGVIRQCPEGWYLYMVGQEVPAAPSDRSGLLVFLRQLETLLKAEHDHDYCGIVYTDKPENPSLVKIYDPNNLGASCGSSGERVLPGWVLSRVAPEALDSPAPVPMGRQRWWQRLTRRTGAGD